MVPYGEGMTLNILGKPYTIKKLKQVEASGNMGSASGPFQIITISEGYPKEQVEETLLHEVIHIVAGELAVELDESDVRRLAVGLYSAGCKIPVKV